MMFEKGYLLALGVVTEEKIFVEPRLKDSVRLFIHGLSPTQEYIKRSESPLNMMTGKCRTIISPHRQLKIYNKARELIRAVAVVQVLTAIHWSGMSAYISLVTEKASRAKAVAVNVFPADQRKKYIQGYLDCKEKAKDN